MLIDGFTVAAQVVNFLILVWLMKRYLYQPILKALDAREKHIKAELADADAKRSEALAEREAFKRKNDEFDRQRSTLLSQATDDANTERQRLIDNARTDAARLRNKQQESLRREYQHLNEDIAQRTRSEIFAIARKTLDDLAGVSLEQRMLEVFVQRICTLSREEKMPLAAMLMSPSQTVQIRSAFELAPAQRALIEDAVKTTFAATALFRFEVVTNLLGGIELVIQGQKIAWSIADYLSSLEKDVNELLKVQRKPQ